jgi:nucleoside-diphosphate-sugar epimerase
MSRYLVTGGAGFIGSHLVHALVRRGESVRVLDTFLTGRRENLNPVLKDIELIEADIRDAGVCARAAVGIDFVLHEAALPSVPRSIEEPVLSTEINLLGTVKLLEACVKAGVKRLVFAASSSVYGEQDVPVKHEGLPAMPLSPYAVQKYASEEFCKIFSESKGLETVCLRYFNIFGPGQDPNSPYSAVIPIFIRAIRSGKRPTIYGDGHQSRDFTYIENVIEANLLAVAAPGEQVSGKSFNIGCGRSYSLLDVLGELNVLMGTNVEPDFAAPRAGDVKHSLADIERARVCMGYEVTVGFHEGLRRTVEAFKA